MLQLFVEEDGIQLAFNLRQNLTRCKILENITVFVVVLCNIGFLCVFFFSPFVVYIPVYSCSQCSVSDDQL